MQNLFWRTSVACSLFILLAASAAATEPAVSKMNAKTGVTIGSIDGDNISTLDGSLTIPLGNPAGIQIDAGFGQWESGAPVGDIDITRLGVRLFARNPQLGMAGIYTSLNELEGNGGDIDIEQYGVEGEFYSKLYDAPLTFSALFGQYDSDFSGDDLLGTIDVRWYPLDELMVELGAAIVDNDKKTHVGAEYQLLQSLTSFMALSAYADLAVGEDSYDHALLGIRGYFGKPKALSNRHRGDTLNNTTDRLNPPLKP